MCLVYSLAAAKMFLLLGGCCYGVYGTDFFKDVLSGC